MDAAESHPTLRADYVVEVARSIATRVRERFPDRTLNRTAERLVEIAEPLSIDASRNPILQRELAADSADSLDDGLALLGQVALGELVHAALPPCMNCCFQRLKVCEVTLQ